MEKKESFREIIILGISLILLFLAITISEIIIVAKSLGVNKKEIRPEILNRSTGAIESIQR